VDSNYGKAYRELFERHWWWRARTELIIDTLRALRPDQGWQRILDIGCGDGLFFDRLAEFGKVEGVESSAELVSPENPHRSVIYTGPFDESFQPGEPYSLILMLDVLEHLEHPAAALRHAMELLAPGGVMVITVPAFMSLWTNHDDLNRHYIRYTKRTFRKMADQAGFHIQRERYFCHWTFPVKLAVRALERMRRSTPQPPKIPGAWINEALFRLSRMEHKTMTALSLPFGSSLMVVGIRNGAQVERPGASAPVT
jgi:2-polyprenyl-3-methyl-5-hydroxy-6-metoxy-1,4-benzoquinol methylase